MFLPLNIVLIVYDEPEKYSLSVKILKNEVLSYLNKMYIKTRFKLKFLSNKALTSVKITRFTWLSILFFSIVYNKDNISIGLLNLFIAFFISIQDRKLHFM